MNEPTELQEAVEHAEAQFEIAEKDFKAVLRFNPYYIKELVDVAKRFSALQKENEELRQDFKQAEESRVVNLGLYHRVMQERDSLTAALKECAEALNHNAPTGWTWLEYLNYQFPATQGHVPLIEHFQLQKKALSNPHVQKLLKP